jgi:hypothetical protein
MAITIKIDWKGLKAKGYTKQSFKDGCCPDMAWVIHEQIPNSTLLIGLQQNDYDEEEGGQEIGDEGMMLSHCVVLIGDLENGETYDAGGPKAIERWNKTHETDWDILAPFDEEEEFDRAIDQYGGKITQIVIDKIRPFVKVITT